MAAKSGKHGRVTVGSTNIPVVSWQADHMVEKLDSSNTEGLGKREYDGGLEGLDVTVTAHWRASEHPYASPPDIKPTAESGGTIALKLYVDKNANVTYDIATFFVENVQVSLEVAGLVQYTITGSASGGFTPAGTGGGS